MGFAYFFQFSFLFVEFLSLSLSLILVEFQSVWTSFLTLNNREFWKRCVFDSAKSLDYSVINGEVERLREAWLRVKKPSEE